MSCHFSAAVAGSPWRGQVGKGERGTHTQPDRLPREQASAPGQDGPGLAGTGQRVQPLATFQPILHGATGADRSLAAFGWALPLQARVVQRLEAELFFEWEPFSASLRREGEPGLFIFMVSPTSFLSGGGQGDSWA